jgi:hypothetical protein
MSSVHRSALDRTCRACYAIITVYVYTCVILIWWAPAESLSFACTFLAAGFLVALALFASAVEPFAVCSVVLSASAERSVTSCAAGAAAAGDRFFLAIVALLALLLGAAS